MILEQYKILNIDVKGLPKNVLKQIEVLSGISACFKNDILGYVSLLDTLHSYSIIIKTDNGIKRVNLELNYLMSITTYNSYPATFNTYTAFSKAFYKKVGTDDVVLEKLYREYYKNYLMSCIIVSGIENGFIPQVFII